MTSEMGKFHTFSGPLYGVQSKRWHWLCRRVVWVVCDVLVLWVHACVLKKTRCFRCQGTRKQQLECAALSQCTEGNADVVTWKGLENFSHTKITFKTKFYLWTVLILNKFFFQAGPHFVVRNPGLNSPRFHDATQVLCDRETFSACLHLSCQVLLTPKGSGMGCADELVMYVKN